MLASAVAVAHSLAVGPTDAEAVPLTLPLALAAGELLPARLADSEPLPVTEALA